MMSFAGQPGWFDACAGAMRRALELRMEFFEAIFEDLQRMLVEPIVLRMQNRESLAHGLDDSEPVPPAGTTPRSRCTTTRSPGSTSSSPSSACRSAAEVLDPRMVRIPAGKFTENHKQAHETLIHILEGSGQVVIDDRVLPVAAGDSILVPRWAMHQTQNLGTSGDAVPRGHRLPAQPARAGPAMPPTTG